MTTFSNTADHATDAISHARAALLDLPGQMMKLVDSARDSERRGVDSLLDRMGLQRRQSAFAPVIWIAAGAVVAGAAAILLAPTSGKELRRRIASFLDSELDTATAQAKKLERRVEDTLKREAPGIVDDVNAPNGIAHETSR
jgi:hypothetical protein